MKRNFLFLALIGILIIFVLGGCVSQQQTGNQTPVKQTPQGQPPIEQPAVKLTNENYIVDDKGKTLYLFAKDVMGDSQCTDACLKIWPVFYSEKISVSSGLNSSDFDTITRIDGNKQTTFKGWPLYYFSSDVNPGDIKGEGVNSIWFIARSDYKIFIADKDNLQYIVDVNGNTLYNFTKDQPDVSNCKGGCLKAWPVFYAENIVVPSIMNNSDFSVITNSEGTKQTTYNKMPLYYYINDTARGDINGQGVNDAWFIVEPAAKGLSTTTQTQNASSTPAIKVTSFPQSAHGDTIVTIKWEVIGGTESEISNTAIIWGYSSAGENVSDYPKSTVIQTGKTPKEFSAGINIPSSGTLYFRIHAVVDGSDIYSLENQISIIQQTSGY